MKFNQLRAVAHNIAHSMAEGNGFLVGHYIMDEFDASERFPDGLIEVDLLTGRSSGGSSSASLRHAFILYSKALPSLCSKHGGSSMAFGKLSVRFSGTGCSPYFVVTVEGHNGRRAVDEYLGWNAKRSRVLDPLGRARRKPGTVTRVSVP